MRGAQFSAARSQDLLDLERAARVGAREQIRLCRQYVRDFARTDLVRALRLDEVVDPGATTTLVAVRNLDKVQLRNPAKKLSRRGADLLRVREVTRVVIRDASLQRMARRDRRHCREKLADVANFLRKDLGPFRALRFISENWLEVIRVRSAS